METDALKYIDSFIGACFKTLGGIFFFAIVPAALISIGMLRGRKSVANKTDTSHRSSTLLTGTRLQANEGGKV